MTKPTGNPRGRPSKDVARARANANADGWNNVLTGLRAQQDPTRATNYQRDPTLGREELEAIFIGDGVGRRIVEMPAEESIRQWLTVAGDEGEAVCDAMETLRTQQVLTDAYVWARLFGGAAIFRLLDDGQDADQPLRRGTLRSVVGYRVYDRHRITWTTGDLVTDPRSARFGEPELYAVQPINGSPFRVHHSRLAIIDGRRLPADARLRNQGWGASVLQGVYHQLVRVGEAQGYAANIMRDFVQAVLSVKGLSEMLAAGQDELVQKRIQLLDVSRSIINMMVVDADGEAYDKKASSVAGLADLMDRFSEMLSAACGIPMTKLLGRSPAGMNATGEADLRNYYDALKAEQARSLSPVMEELIRDIYTAQDGPTRGREPQAWSVKWNSLWQPTDKEVADLRKTVGETDKIYLDTGVLTNTEVAKARFGQGDWSMETRIEADDGEA